MSGGPFYAHDIGGFAIGNPTPELYVRWTQAGVMCSHTRFHGIGEREPWVYGEEAEAIVREWLHWRYRMIPYLQGCALEAGQTGMPVMRAMALAFPGDRVAQGFEMQYMLGPACWWPRWLNPVAMCAITCRPASGMTYGKKPGLKVRLLLSGRCRWIGSRYLAKRGTYCRLDRLYKTPAN
jgi:hypothetical protein